MPNPTIRERFSKAWNAFVAKDKRGDAEYITSPSMGYTTTYREDKQRLRIGSERTIIASIYNRIAVDVAAINLTSVLLLLCFYQRAGKSIRKTRTRMDRASQGLTQRDIELGRQRVASFRNKRKTVTSIMSGTAIAAGTAMIATYNPAGIPLAMIGISGLSGSLHRKMYYREEARRYAKGHGAFIG